MYIFLWVPVTLRNSGVQIYSVQYLAVKKKKKKIIIDVYVNVNVMSTANLMHHCHVTSIIKYSINLDTAI